MKWQEYIISDPEILGGKLTFKGTRLSLELIAQAFESGWTVEQIFESYPRFTPEFLQAYYIYVHELILSKRPAFKKAA